MDNEEYFISITNEIKSLKNRIRNFVRHWPTDGEWKESVLRTMLRRHLPKSIGVGKGFIVAKEGVSTQIDIILYDTTRPILYQEGDLLILTPDATLGAIEVKTNLLTENLETSFSKLANIAELASHSHYQHNPRFFGFFSYEGEPDTEQVLLKLQNSVNQNMRRLINCVSIGESFFIRFWNFDPSSNSRHSYEQWHSYNLSDKAPAYFILNAIEHLCPLSLWNVDELWFPKHGKEPYKTNSRSLIVTKS